MSIGDGRAAIELVAIALADLRNDVMFLGGATTGLLVTNRAAPPPRLTDDVDVVADVATYAEHVRLTERLRDLGFKEDTSEGAATCGWLLRGIKVDVMSTGPVPGPTNRWYAEAMENTQVFTLGPQLSIRVIAAPYFIADKLDTFGDGRRGDYLSSRDLEDVISVLDGRATIEAEIRDSPSSVREFLGERFRSLLADPTFVDAVAGHLPGDSASQARAPLIVARMGAIAAGT